MERRDVKRASEIESELNDLERRITALEEGKAITFGVGGWSISLPSSTLRMIRAIAVAELQGRKGDLEAELERL